jgi:hypothetical protein
MHLSLTTSGLLDPKRLDSWVPEKRRAIRKAVESAILVYKSDNVSITETICSAGSLSAQGTATVTVTDELMFEETDAASLSVPARAGIGASVWYGRSLGSLTLQAYKVTVKSAVKGVGVAKVTYEAQAQVYVLASPASLNGETDFSILALIKGSAT